MSEQQDTITSTDRLGASKDPAGWAWLPTPQHLARSRLLAFMRRHDIPTYDALLARSTDDPEWFWDAVVQDLDLEFYEPYTHVMDSSSGLAWTRWFTGGRYNYVHNALDKHAARQPERPALLWEGEDGEIRRWSYGELLRETNHLANGLRSLGITKGDRVGIFMPMVPETVAATLACSKIGAVFTPIFSGLGAPAAAARLADCEARLLITSDGFLRRGSPIPMKEVADEAASLVPTVERLLVHRRLGGTIPWTEGRDVWWHDLVDGQPDACETERTDPEDPYMIIYTSGTTGRPKGAVHSHAGFPIKATQDLVHCFDLHPDDTLFWFTDLGWMMGPWAIAGTLTVGATLLMYEGAPDFPNPGRLWQMVECHGVTVLGLSPTLVRALMRQGDGWVEGHPMDSLRVLGSTGEPWNPDPWRWYFEKVGGTRCPVINYSGGTEISGGILGCTTIQPQKPCAFTGPVPGMAVDVLDESGLPVRGGVGELVIRRPWVGMTRGFWKDPARYMEAYWSRWPGIWVHGDFASVDADGAWFIHGRSDDTIKVAGKRLGPAEVESAAVSHPAVSEAAAVGVPDELKGEAVVCFVVLRPGLQAGDQLRREIRDTVAHHLGKALAPKEVRFVKELPRTRNAKIMRRVVRAAYLGLREMGDLSSLENPSAVDEIARAA